MGAGWTTEADARVVVNSKKQIKSKTALLTAKRKKNKIHTIAHCHYWLVCYKGYDNGVFPWADRRQFGFMDTAVSTLKSTVLTENPSIPATYRLVDQEGHPLNPYEKHMGEIIEQLTRFIDRDAFVLDFCCGTGSAALACLYLNQRFILCNDRDQDQVTHAETRAKAYLWAIMQSRIWAPFGDTMANPYHMPGHEIYSKWDGQDPYLPLMVACRAAIKSNKELCVPHNIPRNMTIEKMSEIHSVVVGPNEQYGIEEKGVYLLASQTKGTAFPLFGTWKRRQWQKKLTDQQAEDDKLSAIMVKALPGETSPFMMKVSEKCPFLHVRNPAAANKSEIADGVEPADLQMANCVVEENQRMDMSDMFKVHLVLTEDILVEDGDPKTPVELLCKYEFLKAKAGWKAHAPSNRRKSLATVQAGDDIKNKRKQPKKTVSEKTSSSDDDSPSKSDNGDSKSDNGDSDESDPTSED